MICRQADTAVLAFGQPLACAFCNKGSQAQDYDVGTKLQPHLLLLLVQTRQQLLAQA